jgi:hypothetical protein
MFYVYYCDYIKQATKPTCCCLKEYPLDPSLPFRISLYTQYTNIPTNLLTKNKGYKNNDLHFIRHSHRVRRDTMQHLLRKICQIHCYYILFSLLKISYNTHVIPHESLFSAVHLCLILCSANVPQSCLYFHFHTNTRSQVINTNKSALTRNFVLIIDDYTV